MILINQVQIQAHTNKIPIKLMLSIICWCGKELLLFIFFKYCTKYYLIRSGSSLYAPNEKCDTIIFAHNTLPNVPVFHNRYPEMIFIIIPNILHNIPWICWYTKQINTNLVVIGMDSSSYFNSIPLEGSSSCQ